MYWISFSKEAIDGESLRKKRVQNYFLLLQIMLPTEILSVCNCCHAIRQQYLIFMLYILISIIWQILQWLTSCTILLKFVKLYTKKDIRASSKSMTEFPLTSL